MVEDATPSVASNLVIGVLLTRADQMAGAAIRSIEALGLREKVRIDITVCEAGMSGLGYAQSLQDRYRDDHILILDENACLPSSFLDDVVAQIRFFADKNVRWGVIGNSGLSFPYFKPIRNLLSASVSAERFPGVFPAAHLDPYLLLIHRDVNLSAPVDLAELPSTGPLNDLVGIASWEAGLPCWICSLPIYLEGEGPALPPDSDCEGWAHYLSQHYNNASFVSSFGTIEIKDSADKAKDFYYSQVAPTLDRATKSFGKTSIAVFLFATYYDLDIMDRCLMSVASQFTRAETLFIIGLEELDGNRRAQAQRVIDGYRHYLSIRWAEEELPGQNPKHQLATYLEQVPADGLSLLLYDTFVLFPQAISQICEFKQWCLGDRDALPVTTAEISRLVRSVESNIPSQPRAFFREVEKLGFTHNERWLSSQSSSTLHFSFPNRFLRDLDFETIDLHDLGSCLPQALLAEKLSFLLVERGSGYMSFQKPGPDETISPIKEEGTPLHLANKARALIATKPNLMEFSIEQDRIVPALSYHADQQIARLRELVGNLAHVERELADLRHFSQQQESLLNKLRNSWCFAVRQRGLRLYHFFRGLARKQ